MKMREETLRRIALDHNLIKCADWIRGSWYLQFPVYTWMEYFPSYGLEIYCTSTRISPVNVTQYLQRSYWSIKMRWRQFKQSNDRRWRAGGAECRSERSWRFTQLEFCPTRKWRMMITSPSDQAFNKNAQNIPFRIATVARSGAAHKWNCTYELQVTWFDGFCSSPNVLLPSETLAVDRDGVLMKAANYR